MKKHTPGPWVVETYHGSLFKICKPDFKPGDEVSHRLEADRALISAAPEMLDMLETLLLEIEDENQVPTDIGSIKRLIAKARGE